MATTSTTTDVISNSHLKLQHKHNLKLATRNFRMIGGCFLSSVLKNQTYKLKQKLPRKTIASGERNRVCQVSFIFFISLSAKALESVYSIQGILALANIQFAFEVAVPNVLHFSSLAIHRNMTFILKRCIMLSIKWISLFVKRMKNVICIRVQGHFSSVVTWWYLSSFRFPNILVLQNWNLGTHVRLVQKLKGFVASTAAFWLWNKVLSPCQC